MKQTFWIIGILLAQILIFNHIHIYGFGTPFVCVFPILLFSFDTPRWKVLIIGFLIGLIEDIFINTPGIMAATLTFIAMIQPHILKSVYIRDENNKNLEVSVKSLGWKSYTKYILITCIITSFIFFSLEAFSVFNYTKYLINIASTWIVTVLFIMAIESVRNSKT